MRHRIATDGDATGWESSTIRANSFIQRYHGSAVLLSCEICCWHGLLYAIYAPRICWIRWRKNWEKCYEVPVGFKHISAKMTKQMPLSAANPRRPDRKRPYPWKGRRICSLPACGNDSRDRQKAVSDLCRHQKRNAAKFIWKSGITSSTRRKRMPCTKSFWKTDLPELPYEMDHVSIWTAARST